MLPQLACGTVQAPHLPTSSSVLYAPEMRKNEKPIKFSCRSLIITKLLQHFTVIGAEKCAFGLPVALCLPYIAVAGFPDTLQDFGTILRLLPQKILESAV